MLYMQFEKFIHELFPFGGGGVVLLWLGRFSLVSVELRGYFRTSRVVRQKDPTTHIFNEKEEATVAVQQ